MCVAHADNMTCPLYLVLHYCGGNVGFRQNAGDRTSFLPTFRRRRTQVMVDLRIDVSFSGKMAAKIKEVINIFKSGVVYFCGGLDIWLAG